MLLRYKPKYDHIKCVPLIIPNTPEAKKLKIERPQVQLLPGVNEVTDDEYEVMKLHLAREIKSGEISVIEKEVKGKTNPAGGKAHDLKTMPAKDAVILVGECVNPETLAKWHKEETRDEVRLAIVEKMKELKIDIPKFIPGFTDDDDSSETGAGAKNLDDMTDEELKAYADEKKIKVSGSRADVLAAIKKAEAK